MSKRPISRTNSLKRLERKAACLMFSISGMLRALWPARRGLRMGFEAVVACAFGMAGCAVAEQRKPNIVLILADDVSADMFSCYGRPGSAKTPNIDRIASEGVQFRTCMAPAICGPSRALLMTGVYAGRTGAFRNDIWVNGARSLIYRKFHSWAKLMRQNGYRTAIASKWHAGAQRPFEAEVGFEEYCLWEGPNRVKEITGVDVFAEGLRKKGVPTDIRYWYPSLIRNGKYVPVTESDFGPDICAEFIMDFISRKAKANEPFVAYWPTAIPHGPYVTTPDRGGPDKDCGILRKPDFGSMKEDEKAKAMRDYETEHAARFVALIEYLDKLVGKVIKKTEDLGIYENTYFIFCADNGTACTAKDRGVERGVHVPYVVRGPGVKRLGVTDELTDFADIAPTLLDIGGTPQPKGYSFDGKSQLPFLTGRTPTHREWVYAYTGPVQVFRTKHYLLEARAPFYGKPYGRMYYTADKRFGEGYARIEDDPTHAAGARELRKLSALQGDHLGPDHPFWQEKKGIDWASKNRGLEAKQLYNHPDYKRYDETD